MVSFPLLGGKLLLQDTPPRPSEDALWLAATMPKLPSGSRVLDAACGSGIVGLALRRHQPDIILEALDIDPACTHLAANNAVLNSVPLITHTADLLDNPELPLYDAILCNPPYHEESRGHRISNPTKKQARCLPDNHFPLWLTALTRLLTPTGQLHLILHTACEAELKAFAAPNYTLHLTPLQTTAKRPPKRLLATLQTSSNPQITKHPLLEGHNPQTRQTHLF